MTVLEENSLNFTEDGPDVEIAIVPPQKEGVTDVDSDDSDNEVTGTFLHLPRRILNRETETTDFSNSLDYANFSSASRPLKKRKKILRKWNASFETSQVLVEPLKTYGPSIDGFLDSEICTPLDSFLKLFSSDLLEEIVR